MNLKKATLLVLCLVACFWMGCTDKDDTEIAKSEELSVVITSPGVGAVLTGDKTVNFDCEVTGGKKPYSYKWTSNLDGQLAITKSFSKRPSELVKGSHTIIVKATDSSGKKAEGSVFVRAL